MTTAVRRSPGELVLLAGTYRPAVAAARALGRRGRRVIAGVGPDIENVEGSGGVERSRHVSRVWRHSAPDEQPDAFLAELCEEVARHPEPVWVLPFYEPVFVLLSRARDRLPPNARFVGPTQATVETCLDKERCLEVAAAAGLPSVPRAVVGSARELREAVEHMGAVAVRPIPPQTRLLGRKAVLVRSVGHLDTVFPTWPAEHPRLLVQRLIDGPRLNLHFAARDGLLLGAVEVVAARTDQLDGTGLTVAARSRPLSRPVREQLASLLAAVQFSGVGLAQFIVDRRTSEVYLIELNPRLGSIYVIAERAGLDLANVAVDIAAGRTPTLASGERSARVRSAWTLGDLNGLRRARREEGIPLAAQAAWLGRMTVDGLRADVHAIWSWRDPVPAVLTWSRYLYRTVFARFVRRRP